VSGWVVAFCCQSQKLTMSMLAVMLLVCVRLMVHPCAPETGVSVSAVGMQALVDVFLV